MVLRRELPEGRERPKGRRQERRRLSSVVRRLGLAPVATRDFAGGERREARRYHVDWTVVLSDGLNSGYLV